MKKRILIIHLLLLSSFLIIRCRPEAESPQTFRTRIILVNPDLGDLSSFVSMMGDTIIRLPETELLAVYYSGTGNRCEPVKAFVEQKAIRNVRFEMVDGELNETNLFLENPCSGEFERLFRNSDGIVFFGGADFPPSIYGQKTHLLTSIQTPERHHFELSFLFHLLGGYQDEGRKPLLEEKPDYVVYGFCLGMQSMNVAAGGTMHQDIPTDIYDLHFAEDVLAQDPHNMHRNYWRNLASRENLIWCNYHQVQCVPGQFFVTEMKLDPQFRPYVCSSHHQAVKDLGKGLAVAAYSADGKVVEALEHREYENVLGVQFHPEAYAIYTPDAEKHKLSPQDSLAFSEYDMINYYGSLDFHRHFWAHFSACFAE